MAIDTNHLLLQLLNGISLGLLYVLVSSGLTVIFGVTGILNFAHGALYMLGAYFAVLVVGATGNFWLALLVAPLAVGVVGIVIERTTLHYLYDRNIAYQILVTFGISLMLIDGVGFLFGSQREFDTPELLSGPVALGSVFYPRYKLFVILAGTVVAMGLWAFFRYTDFGLIARAGAQNQATVRILGIDISRYFTLVFGLGAGLAGVAGVLAAPFLSVTPGMGNDFLLVSFIVVVLGGLGSFRGAVVAGLLIGVTGTLGETFVPELSGYYIYIILIGTLVIRPQGLFGNYDRSTIMDKAAKLSYSTVVEPIQVADRRFLVALGVFLAFPLVAVFTSAEYYVGVLTLMLIWGLIALSLDVALGYMGLLSFGHAAFFGVGAYVTGLLVLDLTNSLLLALVVAVPLVVVVAWLIGALSIRFAGVFFAIITLAIAQLFYQLSINWTSLTGGTSGLQGIPAVKLFGSTIADTVPFYYLTLIAVVVAYALSVRLLESPFGRIMVAIREGERRTAFLGYDTTLYKRRALAFSGGIAGLAGVLYAGAQGFVTPNALHWTISGDALFGVILGGMGTLFGPLVGGAIYAGLQQVLSSYIDEWRFVIGLLLVLSVMFAPRGLVSIYAGVADWIDSGSTGDAGERRDPSPPRLDDVSSAREDDR